MTQCHNCSFTGNITKFESETIRKDGAIVAVEVTCPKCENTHKL